MGREESACVRGYSGKTNLLLAPVVGLGSVLEKAGVLNGHGLSNLGLGTGALLYHVNFNAHVGFGAI